MNEEKKIPKEGKPTKKFTPGQKPPAKVPQKERIKSEAPKEPGETESGLSLLQKIDDIAEEIEKKPLKSFEKKDQEKLFRSYEKLVLKMVQAINKSRR